MASSGPSRAPLGYAHIRGVIDDFTRVQFPFARRCAAGRAVVLVDRDGLLESKRIPADRKWLKNYDFRIR